MRPLTFRDDARAEFDEAHDWYEDQEPGLGDRFSEHVQEVLDRIAANPELHQVVHKDIRRGIVRDFPYTVYYRVLLDEIRVIAVFHGSRNPGIWQSRS
jgi:plasmid stabilization system protein ParE